MCRRGAYPIWMLGMLGIAIAGTQWVEERDARALPRFSEGAVQISRVLLPNWRLGERERRRAAQYEALYDVGLAMSGEQSLDEVAAAARMYADKARARGPVR